MDLMSSRLDNSQTLHIRCGSDIKDALLQAGFVGHFLEFSDPYCQGPVQDLTSEELIQLRTPFIAQAYGLDEAEVQNKTQQSYNGLAKYDSWQRVVLWFEHDSYDQLILAYLLAYFHRQHLLGEKQIIPIEMICIDKMTGVEPFWGLGQLGPEQLTILWQEERRPVTVRQLIMGEKVWRALCSKTVEPLEALISEGDDSLPLMKGALQRHLQELPNEENGLSLTQTLILQLLEQQDDLTVGKLFGRYMREVEPLPWLGDLMFWSIIKELESAIDPLISVVRGDAQGDDDWPTFVVSITATGSKVLKGEQDYRSLMSAPRWVGGVCIQPKA